MRRGRLRSQIAANLVVWLLLAGGVGSAAAATQLKVLFDLDNNPATGCTIPTVDGPFAGAEQVLTTTVEPASSQVVGLVVQTCGAGGVLGAPVPVTSPFAPPWPAGVGTGTGGSDVVETYVPLFAGAAPVARVAFTSDNGAGGLDALLTTTGQPGGPPILLPLGATAIPTLGTWSFALLVALLLVSGTLLARRRGLRTGLWVALLGLTVGVGLVWAAIVLDGQTGDWVDTEPVATDPTGDAAGSADLREVFARAEAGNLFFRFDGGFICSGITVSPTAVPAGALGVPYGPVTFTQTGGVAPITWSKTGALPAGLSLSAAGVLSGTPTQGGSFPLTISATDARGCAGSQAVTVVIATTGPPAFTSANATTFTVGSADTFTVTTTGVPPVTTIGQMGALPTGVTFTDNGNGTGTLSGTPAAGTAGPFALTFTASNGIAPDATQNFTLTVQQPPAITSANATTFTIGQAGTFTVTTTGFPTPAITRGGVALPSGVTFIDNGNGTGTLSGTPGVGTGGTYAISFTANNGVAPNANQAFTLTVSQDQAPAITSANATTFTVGQAGTFTVTTTGFPAVTTITRGGVALPSGVTFVDNGNGTGTLSGTPGAGTAGTYALTFTASNGVLPNAVQNFTLTVNQGPAITSANATTFTVGQAGTFTVTTTGFPTPAITRGGVALPTGVAFVDNGNGTGTLSGTPGAGTGGTYAITFTATNVASSSPVQNFTLTVNQGPAITSANATTFTVGQAGTFSVTTSGFPTVATITRGGVALPGGVNYTDNGNGTATLSGTPNAGTGGTYVLTFTASNGVSPDAVQNPFTLTINQPPAITSANATTFAPGKTGQTFSVTTTGFPTNTISRTGTLPGGVTFTDNGNNTATIAGTPAAGTQGSSPYAWVITAANGVTPNDVQNPFTFNVICPVITVSGTIPALTVNTAMATATFTQTGGNGTIAWSSSGLPTGTSINSGNGQVTGTPTVTGTFSVTITATDAGACTGATSQSVTVAPVATGDAYSGLVDNTQFVITGGTTTSPATPFVGATGRIITNDLPSGGVTATAGTVATSAGGSVTIAADGTFIYTPKANPTAAAITSDSFTYTISSNTGGTPTPTTANGTVSLTLAGRVWYVLNTGAAGNGQSQSTFNTLSAAVAASTANDTIFVYQGTGTTTNLATASILKTGQSLIGQGVALVVNGNTLVAAGGFPLIGNTVTLAGSVTVNGLDMTTGASSGIVGTSVTGVTVTVRDLTTTTGTAVNIGGAGNSGTFVFRSVSANGGSNGILLQNTTGSFTVTGNSSGHCGGVVVNNTTAPTAPDTADCTGGTIQNAATGIRLDNVTNVSLTRMRITGTSSNNFGIYGTSVNGFSLSNTVIHGTIGATTGAQDAPLVFGKSNPSGLNGLSGTNSITDSTISGGIEHNMEFYNQSGSFTLSITRTVVQSNSVAGGSDGIQMEMQGTASATVSVDNCYFNDNKSQAIQVAANDSSVVALTVKNSKWTRTLQGNEGVVFSNGSNGQLTANVDNNIATDFGGVAIFVGQTAGNASASSKLHATIQNNTVTAPTTATNHAIIAFLTSTVGAGATARIRVDNNDVTQNSTSGVARGILIDTPDASTNPNFHATATNNSVSLTDTVNGIGALVVQARQSSTACMNISANTVTVATAGVNAIRARQVAPATANLFGAGANAAAVLAANNPASTTEVIGTIGLTGVGCLLPDSPTLP